MTDFQPIRFGTSDNLIYVPRKVIEEIAIAKSAGSRPSAGKIFSDMAQAARASTGPGQEKPTSTPSFALLRAYRRASPIDRTIILKRMSQIKRVARVYAGSGTIGFAVRHVNHNDPTFEVPPALEKLAKQLETRLLANPTKIFHEHARDFWVKMIQDELVMDRKVMIIRRDREGKPVGYHGIDGATIKPVVALLFETIKEEFNKTSTPINQAQAVERIYNAYGIDVTNAAYVQVIDAKVVAAWKADELSIDITNPTSETNFWGYGESALEQSLQFTENLLHIMTYNTELFKLNYPETMLMITGDYDSDGISALKATLLGNGANSNWRMPFLLADKESTLQTVKLRDTPKDMMFMEFWHSMVNLKTAAYNMPSSLINIDGTLGKERPMIDNRDMDVADIALDEGAIGLCESMCDWLSCLVTPYHPDLRVVMLGHRPENEQARIDLLSKKQWYSLNEVRIEDGKEPINEIPENPADIPPAMLQPLQVLNGIKQQEQQAQQQQQQQAAGQMPKGYDQGDFGDDPWGMPDEPEPDQGDEAPQQLQKSRPHYLQITVDERL